MEKLNLKQKLVAIRKTIGPLQKTEKGNQGAQYVDPAVLLLKIRDGMDKHGVLLMPQVDESTMEQIKQPTKNNKDNMGFFGTFKMMFIWVDSESDEKIIVPWFSSASHLTDPAMCFGGALTYTERYFLLKFFQIPTTKDDPEFLKGKAGVLEFVDDGQVANINTLIDETKTEKGMFLKHYNIEKISEIPLSAYKGVVNLLEAKRDKK